MAILDKENRPRGLRMPSLSAIKGSRKKRAESPSRRDSSSDEIAAPVRIDSVPARSLKSQEKELPANPLPSPPPFPSAADLSNQSPYSYANNISKQNERPLPRFPRVPVPKREEPPAPTPVPAPVQQVTPPSSEDQYPIHLPHHTQNAEDPLESFIPEPEPEPDDTGASFGPVLSVEDNGPWTPPDYEPVAAPLNRLHYACYQEHRSMPTSNNVWHALPCMTCQKFDQEIRHRCVFCCLRICTGCFQALQKCPNRSLAQLMEMIPAYE
ncbi:hypothetical protein BDV29DRAFT_175841 [Aspergillus leporis]|jgi:hypothetical protein|uniref:Uncharacterized protein n=1 Tax=Aspergillus leporis TaxID=41062 RepID=A0A5N5WZM6_9EURO|nr:hypothetical protein BDV29DRAFT_175841 [Aspergillus leporis]